jgi:hypothetical protein
MPARATTAIIAAATMPRDARVMGRRLVICD